MLAPWRALTDLREMHPGEYWQSLELLGGVKSGERGSMGGRNAEKTGETTPAVGGSLCLLSPSSCFSSCVWILERISDSPHFCFLKLWTIWPLRFKAGMALGSPSRTYGHSLRNKHVNQLPSLTDGHLSFSIHAYRSCCSGCPCWWNFVEMLRSILCAKFLKE